ncbi:MAG: hypothetical protein EZS28_002495 [Streblomastix strix]|uniref:Uncharacterized protein n=1 Tax=Streblomastix strix TaxID=222440 RepID=A0A5J4X420_9EUKA|nr:MAG: hypothetical protein EZS28_002495 [Streblomastix strix]
MYSSWEHPMPTAEYGGATDVSFIIGIDDNASNGCNEIIINSLDKLNNQRLLILKIIWKAAIKQASPPASSPITLIFGTYFIELSSNIIQTNAQHKQYVIGIVDILVTSGYDLVPMNYLKPFQFYEGYSISDEYSSNYEDYYSGL